MKLALEPYQQQMSDFLFDHPSAALFAAPGLGKTASTLHALNRLFADGAIRAALVIAPLRVAKLTWPNEIQKWDCFRWMNVELLRGKKPSGKAHIYLINYEQLQKLTDLSFCDVVVFDELTKAKNPKSKRIEHVRRLLRHHRRVGLTGTPRPNSLLEIFAQVRLLDNGKRLGSSFEQFKRAWFYPTDYMEYNWVPREGTEKAIYEKISNLALTLRSEDYLDIPDTEIEDIEVPLPEIARQLYDEMEKDLLLQMQKGDVVALNAAVLVNKLLQITGGTAYTDTREIVDFHDAKLQALKTLCKGTSENVLIACNYIHERERICQALGATDASKYHGDIERDWNANKIRWLVADPRSLGHGLNLQGGGRTIVWYSPTWSRELYDQFNARVARKGQDKPPLVYRIICSNTVDEAVVETLRERGQQQGEMLSVLNNLQQLRT